VLGQEREKWCTFFQAVPSCVKFRMGSREQPLPAAQLRVGAALVWATPACALAFSGKLESAPALRGGSPAPLSGSGSGSGAGSEQAEGSKPKVRAYIRDGGAARARGGQPSMSSWLARAPALASASPESR